MANAQSSSVTFTVRDHSDESSTVTFPIGPIDDTNWVANNAKIATLETALRAATTGNVSFRMLTAYRKIVDDNRPANPYAQREIGLRLFYSDNVNGKKYHLTIPAPDLVVMSQGGTDLIDLTGSLADPIVAAMEAVMQSPDDNPVTVYKGVIVGRRS